MVFERRKAPRSGDPDGLGYQKSRKIPIGLRFGLYAPKPPPMGDALEGSLMWCPAL